MQFFKKRPKPPLEVAMCLMHGATEIAYQYLCDRKHMPTEDELQLLTELFDKTWHQYCTLHYIVRSVQQRVLDKTDTCKNTCDLDIKALAEEEYLKDSV